MLAREARWVSRSARGDSAADIVDRVSGSEVLADFTSRNTRTCAGSGQMPSLLVISMLRRLFSVLVGRIIGKLRRGS